jgi:hypothetical protein
MAGVAGVEEGLKYWLKVGALPCFGAFLLLWAAAVYLSLDRLVVGGGVAITFTWWTVSIVAFLRARAAHDSHQQLLNRLTLSELGGHFEHERARHAAWYGGLTILVLGLMVTMTCGPAAIIDTVGPVLVPVIPLFASLARRVHESIDFGMVRAEKLSLGLIAEI